MTPWTDDRIEHLKTRWAQGVSGTEIARELNTSRNAVLGKVDRLGLTERVKRNKVARRGKRRPSRTLNAMLHQKAAREALRAEPAPTERADLPTDQSSFAVLLVETQGHHCRWPLGEPSHDMMVCGAKKAFGAYCVRHARIAYA